MANRQNGRSRSPAGARTPRTVPVSCSPAGGWNAGELRTVSRPQAGAPAYRAEPEVRRWPHPVEEPAPLREPALHYIRCALAYQNQLLADIKALLEERKTPPAAEERENPEDGTKL